MNDREQYLLNQIEIAGVHGDLVHINRCGRELRALNTCYACQYRIVDAIASAGGDGYGSSYEHCEPPMGDCPLDK